jgi:hypothetical protein
MLSVIAPEWGCVLTQDAVPSFRDLCHQTANKRIEEEFKGPATLS